MPEERGDPGEVGVAALEAPGPVRRCSWNQKSSASAWRALEVPRAESALHLEGRCGYAARVVAPREALAQLREGRTAVVGVEDDGCDDATLCVDFDDLEGLDLEGPPIGSSRPGQVRERDPIARGRQHRG
jgi:hypothetical protein